MKEFSTKKTFSYDINKLIGIMKFDFYDGVISNKWKEVNNLHLNVNRKKIRSEVDYIENLLNNFDRVVELCEGQGLENEKLLSIELNECNYAIKLIPLLNQYSYIYTYKK